MHSKFMFKWILNISMHAKCILNKFECINMHIKLIYENANPEPLNPKTP